MKRKLYIWTMLSLVLFSCKSIEKMVEKGQYDEAILFAAEKLQGEENKKDKYVHALEDAFTKIMQEDLNRIESLKSSDRAENYGRIYDTYAKIERRQSRITPFLPLISEKGYAASFRMIDPREEMQIYAVKDSEYQYIKANRLLASYNKNDKQAARNAFTTLREIDKYFSDYKDVSTLKEKALNLGTEHVLVGTDISTNVYLDEVHKELLNDFEVRGLDSKWITFYNAFDPKMEYDFEIVLKVEEVRFDRERENVNRFVKETTVQDGFRYVLDLNGNVAKDSLGNDIKEPNIIPVKARITEVERIKSAELFALVEVIDLHNQKVIDRQELVTPVIFNGFTCYFDGDKRALDKRVLGRMDNFLEPFPSDSEMIYNGLIDIKSKARKKIKRVFS